jgi:hypothetical protein
MWYNYNLTNENNNQICDDDDELEEEYDYFLGFYDSFF